MKSKVECQCAWNVMSFRSVYVFVEFIYNFVCLFWISKSVSIRFKCDEENDIWSGWSNTVGVLWLRVTLSLSFAFISWTGVKLRVHSCMFHLKIPCTYISILLEQAILVLRYQNHIHMHTRNCVLIFFLFITKKKFSVDISISYSYFKVDIIHHRI